MKMSYNYMRLWNSSRVQTQTVDRLQRVQYIPAKRAELEIIAQRVSNAARVFGVDRIIWFLLV